MPFDAVGNRLTEVTQAGTTPYVYDIANRLISVNGVTYVWDPRGNLISDGVSTYTYDRANRMITAVQGANNYAFAYNGLGDRLRQTVNGVPTNYRLDLEAGLTQVLSDGTNTYLYGQTRVGEKQPGGWQYHIGDALGSVRQLTGTSASVGLARSYQPFGTTMVSAGSANSIYQFTGEQRDGTGLVYLRARYYAPNTGRLLARDPARSLSARPSSLNPYAYAFSNPLVYTDPTGRTPAAIALAVIVAATAGFGIGATVGGAYGFFTHEWALAGECGCDLQRQAQLMTRWEWAGAHALAGGVIGGVAGLASLVAGGLIVVGGVGVIASAADLTQTIEIIRTETGLTWCTGVRLLLDTAGLVLGTATIVRGVQAWRASGSLLRWAEPARQVVGPAPPGSRQVSVLGHYPSNANAANRIGGNWLDIPVEEWNAMTRLQQEALEATFLDDALARRDVIVLSTPLDKVKPNSWLEWEIAYLWQHGYEFVDNVLVSR